MVTLRLAVSGLMMAGIGLSQISCATLEKDECAVANWFELGRADGERGRGVKREARYREDCAKFGLPIDGDSYRSGWTLGIRRFCTPENGFELGLKGRFYSDSCPANLEAQFEGPYDLGRSINNLDEKLETTQIKIDEINLQLDAEGLPRELRRSLRLERRALREDRREYRFALDEAAEEARILGFEVFL